MPILLKPKNQKRTQRPAVEVLPGGREVCQATPRGRAEYSRRTRVMWVRQACRCGLMIDDKCKRVAGYMSFPEATFDHQDGRGMGGSKRDDRIEKDGLDYNLAVCFLCNGKKGSRSLKQLIEDGEI